MHFSSPGRGGGRRGGLPQKRGRGAENIDLIMEQLRNVSAIQLLLSKYLMWPSDFLLRVLLLLRPAPHPLILVSVPHSSPDDLTQLWPTSSSRQNLLLLLLSVHLCPATLSVLLCVFSWRFISETIGLIWSCVFIYISTFFVLTLNVSICTAAPPLRPSPSLLSKQSGLYQDELQPKQAKQKIRARKSARRRGRIASCQPANWRCPPPSPTAATRRHAWHSPQAWHLTWLKGERY